MPTVTGVVALQRTAGNTAVGHLIQRAAVEELNQPQREPEAGPRHRVSDVGAGRIGLVGSLERGGEGLTPAGADIRTRPRTIQRALTETSDPRLAQEYTAMLASPTFRELDASVTGHDPIRLLDSGPDGPISYNHRLHQIRMPADDPVDDLRGHLLFEMHNARSRGPHRRTRNTHGGDPPENPSVEEKLLAPYRQAALALSVEWQEWSQVTAEYDVRAERIDTDLGGGGSHVARYHESEFDTPGQKWFNFATFLKDQRDDEHTQHYDPDADRPGWVGETILRAALAASPASLRITGREYADFRSGRRKHIKNEANNPFKSMAVVRRAAGLSR
jgi:hypothetical protein